MLTRSHMLCLVTNIEMNILLFISPTGNSRERKCEHNLELKYLKKHYFNKNVSSQKMISFSVIIHCCLQAIVLCCKFLTVLVENLVSLYIFSWNSLFLTSQMHEKGIVNIFCAIFNTARRTTTSLMMSRHVLKAFYENKISSFKEML